MGFPSECLVYDWKLTGDEIESPGELDELVETYNFRRISDVVDMKDAGDSGADNGVGLNRLSQADYSALDSRLLSVITQCSLGSSGLDSSSMGSVTDGGVTAKDLEAVDSLVSRDTLSEYPAPELKTLPAELDLFA